ncbi:hypothetical protein FCM35_KLT21166 [Carex littledalei]|uniref:Uncharacterized protein n=1 Tax=Carex littledalei TaxID=544730 RepID=A0A833R5T5_9POAL|nr:hypothetical protein FCM35_KLT21166 [Carex littledalei]
MKYLCEKFGEKILDMAFTAAIGEIISYVTPWCWNQARVQEMRRKFEELLVTAKMVNPTAQQSNTANLQVQQLLRELQNEAEQESQPSASFWWEHSRLSRDSVCPVSLEFYKSQVDPLTHQVKICDFGSEFW